jgi:hypothetical protein
MREIREEVSSDFFLDRECFMEIIDRGDQWCEFIFPAISDITISFTIDDILDRARDRPYRSEYRSYPEKVS